MTTLMITGSREVADPLAVGLAVAAAGWLVGADHLLHGGARGADLLAAAHARALGWGITEVPAQWDRHTEACPDWHAGLGTCKMAGHRRNAEMLASDPALLLAIPMHPRTEQGHQMGSRGTWGAVAKAAELGVPRLVSWHHVLWPADPVAARMVREALTAHGLAPGPRGEVPTHTITSLIQGDT